MVSTERRDVELPDGSDTVECTFRITMLSHEHPVYCAATQTARILNSNSKDGIQSMSHRPSQTRKLLNYVHKELPPEHNVMP